MSESAKKIIVESLTEAGRQLIHRVVILIFVFLLVQAALGWILGSYDRDSTDGHERSGLKLHVDQLTGCNYLSVQGGGVTPRVSSDGNHFGCKAQFRH